MKGFNTRAVHEGQTPEKSTGAVTPPIYQTSTFAQEAPAKHLGYEYTRADNPNYQNLETALSSLEGAKYGTVFGSGCGAETAVLSILKSGDHVIAGNDLYGGTHRLFTKVFANFGISFDFVDATQPKNFEKALRKETKLIWIETPTNPLLRLTDISAVCEIVRKKKIYVVVDNTFATSYLQRPLGLGADVVIHSTTKYIGGHSDVIGGCAITNNKELSEKLQFARKSMGLNPSPFDCWLAQRGVKTLGLRMERHQHNAMEVARFFVEHPKISKVYYPGLPSHPQYKLASKQMAGFGGMVSAEFRLSVEQTKKLISSFSVFTLAESLGGVESLVCHPATMTHASVPKKEREKTGVTDSLVRFSVGIEDTEDLLEDLEDALAKFRI